MADLTGKGFLDGLANVARAIAKAPPALAAAIIILVLLLCDIVLAFGTKVFNREEVGPILSTILFIAVLIVSVTLPPFVFVLCFKALRAGGIIKEISTMGGVIKRPRKDQGK